MDALAAFLRDPVSRRLTSSITGTDDPGLLMAAWEAWAEAHLAAPLAEVAAVTASVGLAAEWRLADGRRIFFKQVRPGPGEGPRLAAVNVVLLRLRAQGFPLPRPLAGPEPVGPWGWGLAQTWECPGAPGDGHDPALRRAQAAALARLHGLTDGWGGPGALGTKTLPEGRLWGPPHSPLFDFSKPVEGAEALDRLALAARGGLEGRSAPLILSHHDWSSQHLRWEGLELAMVYDTDSFVWVEEAHTVGLAAATFSARWDPGYEPWPTAAEVEAFVDDYARARGPRFEGADRRAALAYAGYYTAYAGRCTLAGGRPLTPALADAARGLAAALGA